METYSVFFEVRAEFLNIWTNFKRRWVKRMCQPLGRDVRSCVVRSGGIPACQNAARSQGRTASYTHGKFRAYPLARGMGTPSLNARDLLRDPRELRLRVEWTGVDYPQGQEITFAITSRLSPGPTQSPFRCVPGEQRPVSFIQCEDRESVEFPFSPPLHLYEICMYITQSNGKQDFDDSLKFCESTVMFDVSIIWNIFNFGSWAKYLGIVKNNLSQNNKVRRNCGIIKLCLSLRFSAWTRFHKI